MANNETVIAQVEPACYCCLSADKLTEYNNGKGLTYWLCENCKGAGFKRIDGLAILVCPCHGQQHHKDVIEESVQYYQRWAKKGKYMYDVPVMTREAKENDKAPMFLLDYREI